MLIFGVFHWQAMQTTSGVTNFLFADYGSASPPPPGTGVQHVTGDGLAITIVTG